MPAYESSRDKQFASTLARGLELLLCFRPDETLLGNKDFVARSGLDKATVSRLTYTLTQLGYLRHDIQVGKYRLGAPVLSMGYPLLASMNLRQIVRPWFRQLADEVRGMVGISVRDRTNMVYMETCRSANSDSPPVDIGAAFPLMVSANGYAWLARTNPVEREKVLNQIKVQYPKMYNEYAPKLARALSNFAAHGYCMSSGYLRPGRLAVAVPMAKPINSEIVVFNCTIAVAGNMTASDHKQLGSRLITLVRSIEVVMGLR